MDAPAHTGRLGDAVKDVEKDVSAMQALFVNLQKKVSLLQLEVEHEMAFSYRSVEPALTTDADREASQAQARTSTTELDILKVPPALTSRWSVKDMSCLEKPSNSTMMTATKSDFVATTSTARLQARWVELHASCEEQLLWNTEAMPQLLRRSKLQLQPHRSKSLTSAFRPSCAINPHSPGCIMWHVMGAMFILVDMFTMPVSIAWNIPVQVGTPQFALFIIMLVYWSVDLVLNFWIGYYLNGELIVARSRVARQYLCGWFPFDIFVIGVDTALVIAHTQEGIRVIRFVRIIRILRLLRFIKLQVILYAIEDYCSLQSRLVIIIMAIFKAFFGILVAAHMMACIWYYIGRAEVASRNWLQQMDDDDYVAEYLQSLQWVLGQFTPAPVRIHPSNSVEMGFTILVIMFALLVMGTSIKGMSEAITRLNSVTWNSTRQKMQLRAYLRSENVPLQLAAQIMNFADFLLQEKQYPALDHTLIPRAQKREIIYFKYRPILIPHPLFELIHQANVDVFSRICNAISNHLHQQYTILFSAGTLAQHLHITVRGSYLLEEARMDAITFYDSRFLAELALFATCLHQSTLQAETHAETFSLTSEDFEHALSSCPVSSRLVCEYSRHLMAVEVSGDMTQYDICEQLVKKTEVYRMLHLPSELEIAQFENAGHPRSVSYVEDSASPGIDLKQLLLGDNSISEMAKEIERLFSEVAEADGLFTRFSHHEDRNRAVASMFSVVWLLRDRYEPFTRPQDAEVRMSEALWKELQLFMRWINAEVSSDMLQAVFVFLAICGLDKVQVIAQQLPAGRQKSYQALICIIEHYEGLVPSVMRLSHDARTMVLETVKLHQEFNLAQFLQAENVPANIEALQHFTQNGSRVLLKCYLLSLLGMMAGLLGSSGGVNLYGSKFMNEQNARNLLLCLNALRQLYEGTPTAIYWSYIMRRGSLMHLPASSLHDLALMRLLCLNRTQTSEATQRLREDWSSLRPSEAKLLTDAFVADGIAEPAFIFTFLPLCFQRAKANPVVGLKSMLIVLAELVEVVNTKWRSGPAVHMVTKVDLLDLANFIDSVKNGFVFQTCIGRSVLKPSWDGLKLAMSKDNWSHVDDLDAPDEPVPHILRQILQCVQPQPISMEDQVTRTIL